LRKDMIRRLISSVEFGKNEVSVVLNPKGLLEKDPIDPDGSGGGGGGGQRVCPGLSPVRVLSNYGWVTGVEPATPRVTVTESDLRKIRAPRIKPRQTNN